MKRLVLAFFALASLCLPVAAQNAFTTPGGAISNGAVQMCLNSSGQAVPCSQPASGAAGFPAGATPVANTAAGTTGAVVATLPAAAGQYTYLCSLQVGATGSAATISPITVAGLLGGSIIYQGITAGGAPLVQSFSPCLRSSAVNTPITVTTTADASATAVNVEAQGFQQ